VDAGPPPPAHTWILDVDGTLVDSLTGTSLRPGALALLELVKARHARVLLWSAGGSSYARERAEAAGIGHLVDGYHAKDGRDTDGRYRTTHVVSETSNVVFVDDRPEDMPIGADVVAVSTYLAPNPHDRGLDRATRRLG
jgi:long-chain acyl-CoA synthetase